MNILALIVCIVICQVAGLLGSIFNFRSIPKWYSKLKKPAFNPPNWIFGPVWTLLYLLMGVSLYLVWISGKEINLAIFIFSIQLILNILWSAIFFGMKKPLIAFMEIILLWIFILMNIVQFYSISTIASYLLIPYLLWVSFAAFLNLSIWELNK